MYSWLLFCTWRSTRWCCCSTAEGYRGSGNSWSMLLTRLEADYELIVLAFMRQMASTLQKHSERWNWLDNFTDFVAAKQRRSCERIRKTEIRDSAGTDTRKISLSRIIVKVVTITLDPLIAIYGPSRLSTKLFELSAILQQGNISLFY